MQYVGPKTDKISEIDQSLVPEIPKPEEIGKLELDTEALLDILKRVLDERKTMVAALKRVQGRCTDLVMENRNLQAENKKFRENAIHKARG
jgi:nucleoside-triphosphatase THEP1